DGAVHDGVLRKGFEAIAGELVRALDLLQLDGFHRTRADIQPDEFLRFVHPEHGSPLSRLPQPRRARRARSILRSIQRSSAVFLNFQRLPSLNAGMRSA